VSYDDPWTCLGCGTANAGRAFCETCGRQQGGPSVADTDTAEAEADGDGAPGARRRRSAGPLIALALTVAAIAATVALTRTPPDERRAHKAVLARSDLDGAWTEVRPSTANAFGRAYLGRVAGSCLRSDGPAGAGHASAGSAFRHGNPAGIGLSRIGSAVVIYESLADAERSLAYLTGPKFAACLQRSLEEDSGHTFGPTERATLSAAPVTSTSSGGLSDLLTTVRLRGTTVATDVQVDVVLTRAGRAIVVGAFFSENGPFPAEQKSRAMDRMLRRLA
jgi:hypothetical protein